VQLVCGQRVGCQRYGSLSDRSQQQELQHAKNHVGCSYLQREVHWQFKATYSPDFEKQYCFDY